MVLKKLIKKLFKNKFFNIRSSRGYVMIIVAFAVPVLFMGVRYIVKRIELGEIFFSRTNSSGRVADKISRAVDPSKNFSDIKKEVYNIAAEELTTATYKLKHKVEIPRTGSVSLFENTATQNVTEDNFHHLVKKLSPNNIKKQFKSIFKENNDKNLYGHELLRDVELSADGKILNITYTSSNGSNRIDIPTFDEDESKLKIELDTDQKAVICTMPTINRKTVSKLAECNANIVIAIPTNFEACYASEGDVTVGLEKGDNGDNLKLNAPEISKYDKKKSPIYVISRTCAEALRNSFLHYYGIALGVIPYSGKLSIDPDTAENRTIDVAPWKAPKKALFKQAIAYGTVGKCGAMLDEKATLKEDLKETTYAKWNSEQMGSGIMYRAGEKVSWNDFTKTDSQEQNGYYDKNGVELYTGAEKESKNIDCLLLNNDNPTESDVKKYFRMPDNPCYLGHCNMTGNICEKNCPTYISNPYYVYELTDNIEEITHYLKLMMPFEDKFNKSNFLFLPLHWAGNLFSNWTKYPDTQARQNKKLGHPARNKKKNFVILIVNKPNNFEPHELTYLGFDNDASEIPLCETDVIMFKQNLKDAEKKVTDKENSTSQIKDETLNIKQFDGGKGLISLKRLEGKSYVQDDGTLFCAGKFRITFPKKNLIRLNLKDAPVHTTFYDDNRQPNKNGEYQHSGTHKMSSATSFTFDGGTIVGNNYTPGKNFGHNLGVQKLKVKLQGTKITSATLKNQMLRHVGDTKPTGLISSSSHCDTVTDKTHENYSDPCISFNDGNYKSGLSTDNEKFRNEVTDHADSKYQYWTWGNNDTIRAYNFKPKCYGLGKGEFQFIANASALPVKNACFEDQNGMKYYKKVNNEDDIKNWANASKSFDNSSTDSSVVFNGSSSNVDYAQVFTGNYNQFGQLTLTGENEARIDVVENEIKTREKTISIYANDISNCYKKHKATLTSPDTYISNVTVKNRTMQWSSNGNTDEEAKEEGTYNPIPQNGTATVTFPGVTFDSGAEYGELDYQVNMSYKYTKELEKLDSDIRKNRLFEYHAQEEHHAFWASTSWTTYWAAIYRYFDIIKIYPDTGVFISYGNINSSNELFSINWEYPDNENLCISNNTFNIEKASFSSKKSDSVIREQSFTWSNGHTENFKIKSNDAENSKKPNCFTFSNYSDADRHKLDSKYHDNVYKSDQCLDAGELDPEQAFKKTTWEKYHFYNKNLNGQEVKQTNKISKGYKGYPLKIKSDKAIQINVTSQDSYQGQSQGSIGETFESINGANGEYHLYYLDKDKRSNNILKSVSITGGNNNYEYPKQTKFPISQKIEFYGRGDVTLTAKVLDVPYWYTINNFFFVNKNTIVSTSNDTLKNKTEVSNSDLLKNKGIYQNVTKLNDGTLDKEGWILFCGDGELTVTTEKDPSTIYATFAHIKQDDTNKINPGVKNQISGDTEIYLLTEQLLDDTDNSDNCYFDVELQNIAIQQIEISNRSYRKISKPAVYIEGTLNEEQINKQSDENSNVNKDITFEKMIEKGALTEAIKDLCAKGGSISPSGKKNENAIKNVDVVLDKNTKENRQGFVVFRTNLKRSFKVKGMVPCAWKTDAQYKDSDQDWDFIEKTGNIYCQANSEDPFYIDATSHPCYGEFNSNNEFINPTVPQLSNGRITIKSKHKLGQITLSGDIRKTTRLYYDYDVEYVPNYTVGVYSNDLGCKKAGNDEFRYISYSDNEENGVPPKEDQNGNPVKYYDTEAKTDEIPYETVIENYYNNKSPFNDTYKDDFSKKYNLKKILGFEKINSFEGTFAVIGTDTESLRNEMLSEHKITEENERYVEYQLYAGHTVEWLKYIAILKETKYIYKIYYKLSKNSCTCTAKEEETNTSDTKVSELDIRRNFETIKTGQAKCACSKYNEMNSDNLFAIEQEPRRRRSFEFNTSNTTYKCNGDDQKILSDYKYFYYQDPNNDNESNIHIPEYCADKNTDGALDPELRNNDDKTTHYWIKDGTTIKINKGVIPYPQKETKSHTWTIDLTNTKNVTMEEIKGANESGYVYTIHFIDKGGVAYDDYKNNTTYFGGESKTPDIVDLKIVDAIPAYEDSKFNDTEIAKNNTSFKTGNNQSEKTQSFELSEKFQYQISVKNAICELNSSHEGQLGEQVIYQGNNADTHEIEISTSTYDFIQLPDGNFAVAVPVKNLVLSDPEMIDKSATFQVYDFEVGQGALTFNFKQTTSTGLKHDINESNKWQKQKIFNEEYLALPDTVVEKDGKITFNPITTTVSCEASNKSNDFFVAFWDYGDNVPGVQFNFASKSNAMIKPYQISHYNYTQTASDNVNATGYVTQFSFSGTSRSFWPFGTYNYENTNDAASFSHFGIPMSGVYVGFTQPCNQALSSNGYQDISGDSPDKTPTEALKQLAKDACARLKNSGTTIYIIKWGAKGAEVSDLDAYAEKTYKASDAEALKNALYDISADIKDKTKADNGGIEMYQMQNERVE